jgi:hypothetical protein
VADTEKRRKVKAAGASGAAVLHSYSPEDYGMTAHELGQGDFKTYNERFL